MPSSHGLGSVTPMGYEKNWFFAQNTSNNVGDVDGDLSFLFFLSFFDLSPYYAGKVVGAVREPPLQK